MGVRPAAAISLDFLIRTKLDVHMYTLPSVVVAVVAAFELFAFCFIFSSSRVLFSSYYPRRTSPSRPSSLSIRTHPRERSRFLYYIYISVPSFIFSGPDYMVKDRYFGRKTCRKILFNEKKKKYRKKKNIYFSIFFLLVLELYYRYVLHSLCQKRTCSILLNR